MKIHIVKKGDTLFELSKKYNVPVQRLIEANPQITNPDVLNIGDKIKIPVDAIPVGGDSENTYKHVVKHGDTLWKLSKAWGLPLQSLINANPQIVDPNKLKVGDVVNIPSGASGGTSNPNPGHTGGMANIPGLPGKKHTGPKAETGKKPTQPINIPAPAPAPAPAPVKQEPVKVEPPKKVPTELKIEVEQIQYETTKLKPIQYEPIKYEPMKYEPIKYEPMKYEPMKYEPMKYEPMKYEPMKYEPAAYEPMKGESAYEPMKGEPSAYEPVQYSPNMYQPMQYGGMPYPTAQPSMVYPASAYPSSPCGCSSMAPYSYQQPESMHPFYQYQMPAEQVSSYYDFPQVPSHQMVMGQDTSMGEYPGIPNPALSNLQNISPDQVYPKGMETQPLNVAYPCYGSYMYPSAMPATYSPVSPYSSAPNPMSYVSPMSQEQPFYPQAPNPGYVGSEFMKDQYDRDSQAAGISEAAVQPADDIEYYPAPNQNKRVKDAKISGSQTSVKNRKKQAASKTSTRKDHSTGKKRAFGNRNPWIND